MTPTHLGVRGFLSLLYHGEKAIDVVETAWRLGILEQLDRGFVSLDKLALRLEARPMRLYKLLDCLEALGLVVREQLGDDVLSARYRSVAPLSEAVRAVVGPDSVERDRNKHPWRKLHGHLAEVLRGDSPITESDFAWPPRTNQQITSFEESMAAGVQPIAESLVFAGEDLLPAHRSKGREIRWLDVGGGDGTVACWLGETHADLRIDVYNLPAVMPIAARRMAMSSAARRLRFVGGDFLKEDLPTGYDVLSFVRVLHDWPASVTRELIRKAFSALRPGGRLVICEEFRSAERLAVQFFWSYFLTAVDACSSLLREKEYYLKLLSEQGFRDARIIEAPFEIIASNRP